MARVTSSPLTSTRETGSDQSARPPPPRSRSGSLARPRTSDGLSSSRSNNNDNNGADNANIAGAEHPQQHHLRPRVPPLPQIPSHFLRSHKPAAVTSPAGATPQRAPSLLVHPSATALPEPSEPHAHAGGSKGAHSDESKRSPAKRRLSLPTLKAREAARLALEGRTHPAAMDPRAHGGSGGGADDLFLQVARDTDQSGTSDDGREMNLRERARSRAEKRRSLPTEVLRASLDRRPKTSLGQALLSHHAREGHMPSQMQQHVNRYSASRLGTPSVASFGPGDDAVSISGRSRVGRSQRRTTVTDQSPISPSRFRERVVSTASPEYGRMQSLDVVSPSSRNGAHSQPAKQDSQSESLAESSEPKQSNDDSESVVSQTAASTVWDELDDLKSRIKKLELTGKIPLTSGAAVSGVSSVERPRTATTAPTTIDSSPKTDRKPELRQEQSFDEAVTGPGTANLHPLLHAALAKAKALLNASLYRSLENTAVDALQLVAMTSSAAQKGTAFSAATLSNDVTVSDRHMRRKADAMCRNLTDLCLALCEGKHQQPTLTASPMTFERPHRSTPPTRHALASLAPAPSVSRLGNRPASRLDARRSSVGLQPLSGLSGSPDESNEDVSEAEQATRLPGSFPNESRRSDRSSSRLLSVRQSRHDEISGDDEPTVRPSSRAMTEFSSMRKSSAPAAHRSSGQHRSPSLRESFALRRVANGNAQQGHRELSRVASLSSEISRRRFMDRSTPPVLEEGTSETEYQEQQVQPRRRLPSLGQSSARRGVGEHPQRTMSLQQRRDVIVD